MLCEPLRFVRVMDCLGLGWVQQRWERGGCAAGPALRWCRFLWLRELAEGLGSVSRGQRSRGEPQCSSGNVSCSKTVHRCSSWHKPYNTASCINGGFCRLKANDIFCTPSCMCCIDTSLCICCLDTSSVSITGKGGFRNGTNFWSTSSPYKRIYSSPSS